MKYPAELRERAVRLVLDAKAEPDSSGKGACRRIGQQLGINADTLRGWVAQAEVDAGTRPDTSSDTATRLAGWNGKTGNYAGRTPS
ncbi:transposase [Frankia sp. Cppng1_Ct_nod]|uniref:transposase n=1 Tax=Frankia sp. Cppng1_Ct_nod TaxID=2897162 RepID=UPI0020254075|nr:transposase [Frankia sp. Cppng1_Ct_nod]